MELPRACGLGARQKSPLQHFDPPDNTFHLYLPTITIGSALTCASSPVLVLARYHRERSILCEKRVCLVSASIGRSILENADSARRCRFRKSQQKRASDLDSIYGWITKLPHKSARQGGTRGFPLRTPCPDRLPARTRSRVRHPAAARC